MLKKVLLGLAALIVCTTPVYATDDVSEVIEPCRLAGKVLCGVKQTSPEAPVNPYYSATCQKPFSQKDPCNEKQTSKVHLPYDQAEDLRSTCFVLVDKVFQSCDAPELIAQDLYRTDPFDIGECSVVYAQPGDTTKRANFHLSIQCCNADQWSKGDRALLLPGSANIQFNQKKFHLEKKTMRYSAGTGKGKGDLIPTGVHYHVQADWGVGVTGTGSQVNVSDGGVDIAGMVASGICCKMKD